MTEISKIFQNSRDATNVSRLDDFGAVGDGVTDNTVAIDEADNSAFDYIYVPFGDFLTTDPLTSLNKS